MMMTKANAETLQFNFEVSAVSKDTYLVKKTY